MKTVDLNQVIKSEMVDRKAFGQAVRSRREELGISLRALAEDIGCSAVFLRDIEIGNRYAPNGEKLKKMEQVLQIPDNQIQAFEDLASLNRGNYADIQPYLEQTYGAVVALRIAKERNMSNEDWEKMFDQFKN